MSSLMGKKHLITCRSSVGMETFPSLALKGTLNFSFLPYILEGFAKIFLVFSSLHLPSFHGCYEAGCLSDENKSVSFYFPPQCVKFISAYFSHTYTHMHDYAGLVKMPTLFL